MFAPTAIALSGANAAQVQLRATAHNIANLGTAGFRRQGVLQATASAGGVDTQVVQAQAAGNALEVDVVSQLEAKNAFLANLAVFRTHDRMLGSLLDASA